MDKLNDQIIIVFVGIGVLWLMTKRWFWIALFFLGAVASLFAIVASLIRFEILSAIGFSFLMLICWVIGLAVASSGKPREQTDSSLRQ